MKNFNYILSFGGWVGLVITLLLIIFFNKCSDQPGQIIKEKTEIHNYYDSSAKLVPYKYEVPGQPIFIPVPGHVDTAKILSMYFAKFPYSRVFEDSSMIATLVDTICQNKFLSAGKFTVKRLTPIRTVESKTLTVEAPKKMALLAGGHANFKKAFFQDWGPDIYLKTKRDQLFGVGYDVRGEVLTTRAAINLNEVFRNKNK